MLLAKWEHGQATDDVLLPKTIFSKALLWWGSRTVDYILLPHLGVGSTEKLKNEVKK
jgi:hypothetical protein